MGLEWKKLIYKIPSGLPKIPLENKIDMLKANAPLKLALAISMSKDTGIKTNRTYELNS